MYKALVLHVAYLGSIPGTTHGVPIPMRSVAEHRGRSKPDMVQNSNNNNNMVIELDPLQKRVSRLGQDLKLMELER